MDDDKLINKNLLDMVKDLGIIPLNTSQYNATSGSFTYNNIDSFGHANSQIVSQVFNLRVRVCVLEKRITKEQANSVKNMFHANLADQEVAISILEGFEENSVK